METKTAKILSVQENQRNYTGKNGVTYIHLIKFEGDPNTWEYHSLKNQCEKFKLNEIQTFDTDIQVNGQYTNYKIKPKQDAGGYSGGGKAAPKDQGIITYLSVFASSCNYHAQRTCTQDDVFAMAERAFAAATSKTTLR